MERKYYITQNQVEDIEHYKRMFEFNASRVEQLCNGEQDDIVYGFELGQMYAHLRECFMKMMELEDNIRNQEIKDYGKSK